MLCVASVTAIVVPWCCSLPVLPRQTQSRGNKASQPAQYKDTYAVKYGWLFSTYPRYLTLASFSELFGR
ncbi:hypothetical protein T4D_11517 [Trichinella pseudospiralis]|uniref:Secreted protein n=1 Tax=Trichinella pseudospiralis TaxID=6337 RepID=A0A0V1F4J5_TRIPS|nr:hypothetical protein T4D_11517 [Trichinella pseudospiralis]